MNMKEIIMKKTNKHKAGLFAVLGICMIVLAVMVVPMHAKASDWEDVGNDWTDVGYTPSDWTDVGYSSPDYSSGYEYTAPSSDYTSDYQYCETCGGYDYSSYPSYDYGSYSSPSYVSTPSYSTPYYVSTPSNYSTPSYVYNSNTAVSNSNSNSSANSNSNSSVGNITNVNNNNNNVVVNVPGGTTTPTTPTTPTLSAYCTINPSYTTVGQNVTFSAYASGGNGNYTYSWSGTDGIYSNSQTFTGQFGTPGSKTATVTVQSGSQSISASCNVNVQGNQNNNISAYCVANPSVANVGQNVLWTVYVNGYNNYNNNYSGNYSYSWSGSDGLYGNGQSINMTYNYPGTKTANVTVYANGQTVTASCNANVQGNQVAGVTVIRTPDQGTPVSGVYLSQVPATGIDVNLKTILFGLGLAIWSGFVAYIMIARKKKLALAGISTVSTMTKAEAFKLKNMKNHGIIA